MVLSQVQVQLVEGCNCLVKKMYTNLRYIEVKEKTFITVCVLENSSNIMNVSLQALSHSLQLKPNI